ncbi:MAG: outer membrane beta-barrel protein [Marinilabiliaceae bacterium]|nr:outer membrane beta-barrel protein [Marinilabiliaceae bacterium]
MRSLILWCFLTIALFNISAQSDFRPGCIITNSLDTLQGLVDYRSELRNMKICTYKDSDEAPSKEFLPGDIYGYRYNTGKFYVSKEIKSDELNDTVFVEFLLKGISNLYYYKNTVYSAYFIESENDELLELRSKEIEFEKDGHVFTKRDNRYLGLLSYALADCPEIRKDIVQADLSHKSLIQITRKYHDYKCGDEACVVYEKKLPVLKIQLKPLIGYSLSHIAFDNSELGQADFQMSSSPFAGLALNFIVPRLNEKLTFLLNLAVNKDYFYGTTFQSDVNSEVHSYYHFYNSNLISSFSLKYTYPKGKFRPDLFVGLYGNSILKSNTKIYSEKVSNNRVYTSEKTLDIFKTFNSGITGGFGIEYKLLKKFRAFSNFSFLYGVNTQNYGLETTFTSYRLSTGLTF